MILNDAIAEIIALKRRNVSQQEIGKALGVTKQYISQIRFKELSEQQKSLLEQYFKIDFTNVNSEDCVKIPVRGNLSASLGRGVEVYNEDKTGTYQLGRKLLHDIGASFVHSEMIFAQGDSMEPTIVGGDSLLVDLSKTEIYDGKIYCVRIENKLYAKRLQLLPPKKIKVISDNKEKYDPFYIDLTKNIDYDFAVIGEVKWWGRVAR